MDHGPISSERDEVKSSLAIIITNNSVIVAATQWIEVTLLGSVATGVAVIAVAFVGFGMLTGRVGWRRGLQVVLGVFILFGAPMIARQLAALARVDAVARSDGV
jgi:type IV secretory pathway VirB2 component (pilin)